jgi:phosphoadenosine phosphosulfate reductase
MSTELFDELEAGELSVEFEGEEPEAVLEWALERFDRIAISTAFQVDGCVLIDMAARIRPDVRVFSIDTGRLPQETHDLADAIQAGWSVSVDGRPAPPRILPTRVAAMRCMSR